MIRLYESGGASSMIVVGGGLTVEQTRILLTNAANVLRARGQADAASLTTTIPFRVVEGTNDFGDEFSILHAVLPLAEYERLRSVAQDPAAAQAFRQLAEVVSELGTFIRFVVADLAMERPRHPEARTPRALQPNEINKLVHKYIGVSGGYLGDFSYRTHHEFYVDLDLPINPYEYDGTTRERFMKILGDSAPDVQADIVEGILAKYPPGSSPLRTQQLHDEIRRWVSRLRGAAPVDSPTLRVTSEVVGRALADAEELLRTTGATSGVDRVHTALHGYVRQLCAESGLGTKDDASLPELFKSLRKRHPAFTATVPHEGDILHVLRALGAILDALSPLRNKASVAHPNDELLPEAEAMLVINSARTILRYLDEKVHIHSATSK